MKITKEFVEVIFRKFHPNYFFRINLMLDVTLLAEFFIATSMKEEGPIHVQSRNIERERRQSLNY